MRQLAVPLFAVFLSAANVTLTGVYDQKGDGMVLNRGSENRLVLFFFCIKVIWRSVGQGRMF